MFCSKAGQLVAVLLCALAPMALGCRTASPAASVTTAGALAGSTSREGLPPEAKRGFDPRFDESEERGLAASLGLISPKQIFQRARLMVGLGPDEQLAESQFREAEDHFRRGEYKKAARKYQKAAGRWPDSAIEEDSLYKLGESQFFSDQYPEANDTYASLLEKYENSRHLDKVIQRRFAIARYWEELDRTSPRWAIVPTLFNSSRPTFDTWGHALKTYESIWIKDPTGPLADDAMLAAANAHFIAERFEEADRRFGDLREMFPKSEHQATAHLLGLRSKLRKYAGPEYNGRPLEEAEKLIDQMLVQFPDKLNDERENLLRTKQSIALAEAERDWSKAEFYAKKRHYGGARYYYNLLVREYPQTRFAQMAMARLEETADKPAEPTNRFTWLSKLFTWDQIRR